MALGREHNIEEARAVLRCLVTTTGRPMNLNMMSRPRLQSLGQDAPSPLPPPPLPPSPPPPSPLAPSPWACGWWASGWGDGVKVGRYRVKPYRDDSGGVVFDSRIIGLSLEHRSQILPSAGSAKRSLRQKPQATTYWRGRDIR